MKQEARLMKMIPKIYYVVLILFVVILVYIAFFENTDVFQARKTQDYHTVENVSKTEKQDADTPLGVKTEYSWTLEQIDEGENCLAFYIVHHKTAREQYHEQKH